MRKHFSLHIGGLALGAALLLPVFASAASAPSPGLWVGEAVLNKVNEVVGGIDAANHVVFRDPAVPTPTKDEASLRLILHVDAGGRVRLLKSVAALAKSTNRPPAVALVTDETLYPNFSGTGRRIASAAFDFGDGKAVDALNYLAQAVADAAGTNSDSGTKATNAANSALTAVDLDAKYRAFATGGILRTGALSAASSAGVAAFNAKSTNATAAKILELAMAAATNESRWMTALTTAQALQAGAVFEDTRYVEAVFAVANAVAAGAATAANTNATLVVTRAAATNAALAALAAAPNALSPVSAGYSAFLASPAFRTNGVLAAAAATAAALTRRALGDTPTEQVNAARAAALKELQLARAFAAADAVVLREVTMSGELTPGGVVTGQLYLGANHPTNPFRHRRHPDSTTGFDITRRLTLELGTNGLQRAGFGVDQISGVYKEEITGLHKPLGPGQNLGLRTEGAFTLNRVSLVDTLNQYP